MPGPRYLGFDTLSLHAGQPPDPATGARAAPIYQSASFVFPDADHAAGLFNLERSGHVYSRLSNPTNAMLEERVAALEGGLGALAVASGQAALHLAVATLMGSGGHIVASAAIYGGSHNMFTTSQPSPPSPTRRTSLSSSTTPSRPPGSAAPSSLARTSSITARPSS